MLETIDSLSFTFIFLIVVMAVFILWLKSKKGERWLNSL